LVLVHGQLAARHFLLERLLQQLHLPLGLSL
jgi:hypothetical protein